MQRVQYESTPKGLVLAVPVSVFYEEQCSWYKVQRAMAHSLFLLQRITNSDGLVEAAVVIDKSQEKNVELLLLIYRLAPDIDEEQFLAAVDILNGLGVDFHFLGRLDTSTFATYPIVISVLDKIWLTWLDEGDGPVHYVLAHDEDYSFAFYPLADQDMVSSLLKDSLPNICLVPLEN